jgi:WD40 repeat protein
VEVVVAPTWEVNTLALSRDRKFVLTGDNWDKIVWLWVFAIGQELRQFIGHSRHVNAGAFCPDCKFVLTGSKDGTPQLRNTDYQDNMHYACSLLRRDFMDEERKQYKIAGTMSTCRTP